jgi:hypothetical protein
MVVRSDTAGGVPPKSIGSSGQCRNFTMAECGCSTDIRGQLIGMTREISDVLLDHAHNYLKTNGCSVQEVVAMSGIDFPMPEVSSSVARTSFD